jgi:hypothetical protein
MGATMAERTSVSAKGWVTALVGVAAALVAVHSLSSSVPAIGASHGTEIPTQMVDRTHKSDRLNVVSAPLPDEHAGRMALRHLMQAERGRPAAQTCEPPASPYVDPQLAKLPGRCLT